MHQALWHRLGTYGRGLRPLASGVALSLLMVTPSNIAGMVRIGPLLVVIAVYYWAVHRPDILGYGMVFLIGLSEDLLGGGPFGVATLTDLMIAGFVFWLHRFFIGKSFLIKWAVFIPIATAVVVVRLALTSLLAFEVLDGHSALYAFLMTVAFYPVTAWLLGGLNGFFLNEEA